MHEPLRWLVAWAVGCALGIAYFAGLWWTVRLCLSARHPALLLLVSLLARTALVLLGFYHVAEGRWQRLLACVLGFIMARFVVTRFVSPPAEANHAP